MPSTGFTAVLEDAGFADVCVLDRTEHYRLQVGRRVSNAWRCPYAGRLRPAITATPTATVAATIAAAAAIILKITNPAPLVRP